MSEDDNWLDESEPRPASSRFAKLRDALGSPELHSTASAAFEQIGRGAVKGALGEDGLDVVKHHGRHKGEISKLKAVRTGVKTLLSPASTANTLRQATRGAYGGARQAGLNHGTHALGELSRDHQVTPSSSEAPSLWDDPSSDEGQGEDIWNDTSSYGSPTASDRTPYSATPPPEASIWGDESRPISPAPIHDPAMYIPPGETQPRLRK